MSDQFDEAAREYIDRVIAIYEQHGHGVVPGRYEQAVVEAAAIARRFARRPPRQAPLAGPKPRPACLDGYEGKWVAVVDDREVVASGDTGGELIEPLRRMGLAGKAVVQYVFPPSDSWRVGCG
jgi:hypothetical protein